MGRHSCCYKQKLRKGLWSPDEDEKLINYITNHGHGCWSSVPKLAGLQRCGKSCRLRWINYLRPDLKRGAFSQDEENLIIELHAVLGNRWAQIAAQLPGRTDNEIKNLWNSSIKKKLKQRGIDPNTHKPLSELENENNKLSTCSKISEKTSLGLDSLNLIREDNSKVSSIISINGLPIQVSTSSNFTSPPGQDFFLDQYLASNGNTSTNCCRPDELSTLVSFQQFGQQLNPNSGFYFNPTKIKSSKDTIPQYNHNSFHHVTSSSILSSNSASIEPSISVPTKNLSIANSDVSGTQNGTRSNGSCNSIEFQSNGAFFDNSVEIQALEGSHEDVKWSEYLQNSTFMVNAVQSQASQFVYSEIKPEIHMLADGPNSGWHLN